MQPEIITMGTMYFIGLEFYGSLAGEGWTSENTIGKLWQRFNTVWTRNEKGLLSKLIRPEIGYEISVWNETEFQEEKKFYIFVGSQIDPEQLEELPLEMVLRVLPENQYAFTTPAGDQINIWEQELYEKWMPGSGYKLVEINGYSYQIQAYEEGRFKGSGEKLAESEIDVFVPVEPA
jgi:predicted transcriptional regulator YdeE